MPKIMVLEYKKQKLSYISFIFFKLVYNDGFYFLL